MMGIPTFIQAHIHIQIHAHTHTYTHSFTHTHLLTHLITYLLTHTLQIMRKWKHTLSHIDWVSNWFTELLCFVYKNKRIHTNVLIHSRTNLQCIKTNGSVAEYLKYNVYTYIYIYIYIGAPKALCGIICLSRPRVRMPIKHVALRNKA
jgi:hypothetical protein